MTALTTNALMLAFPKRRTRRSGRWSIYAVAAISALCLLLIREPRLAELWATLWIGMVVVIVSGTAARVSLAMVRDARVLRMPSIMRAVIKAWVLLLMTIVLIPPIVLGLRGGDFIALAGLLACMAFAAALLPEVPSVYPVVFVSAFSDKLFPHLDLGDAHFAADVWIAAATLGTAAILRWTWRLHRNGAPKFGAMLRRLDQGQIQPDGQIIDTIPRPIWWFQKDRSTTQRVVLGPQHPVSAMRTLLGPPFAPQSWSEHLKRWGILLAAVMLLRLAARMMLPNEGVPWALKYAMIVTGSLAINSHPAKFFSRLRFLFQGQGRQLSELALLPGWSDVQNARRILMRAVFPPLLIDCCCGWLLASLLVFIVTPDMTVSFYIRGAIGLTVLYCMACLNVLAGPSKKRHGSTIALFILALLSGFWFLVPFFLARVLGVDPPPFPMARCIFFWLCVGAWLGLVILHAYQRFAARPHLFLAN